MVLTHPYSQLSNSDSIYASVSLLLLEDQTTQRNILAAKLKKLGIGRVVSVMDGYSALNALSEEHFDIVVVDLIMDDMDGLKFLHLASEQSAQMPAIIVVGAVDDLLLATIKLAAKERGYNLLGAFANPVAVAELNKALDIFSLQKKNNGIPSLDVVIEEQFPADEIKKALENGSLRAYFQPIVSVKKNLNVCAVEALARWAHPEFGEIYPGRFIPVLEHSGLLSEFSRLIIKQSVNQLRRFRDDGLNISVSINITSLELADFDWVEELLDLIEGYKVPPSKIIVEITEDIALEHNPDIVEALARLRLNGISLSIDDFGVGYSSLSNFRRVAFTELKIDQCLTENLSDDRSLQKIVASIIRLGHDLGLTIVAEAVETQANANLLSELGCDRLQGLLFGPAMSGDDVTAWCYERNRQISD